MSVSRSLAAWSVLLALAATACRHQSRERDGGSSNRDAAASEDGAAPEGGGPEDAAAATAGPFSFLVYGDSRSGNGCEGNAVHKSLVARMAREPAAFVVHVGDMVTGYDDSTNWIENGACPSASSPGSFSDLIAPLASRAPSSGLPAFFFPVVGNHDDNWGDGWYPDSFGDGFCSVFAPEAFVPNHTQQAYFSANGVPRIGDAAFYADACDTSDSAVYPTYMYYSFEYRNAHFVVLRLNTDDDDLEICNSCGADKSNYDDYYRIHQLDWLRADLQGIDRSKIENVFVFLHAPLVTTSDGHNANPSFHTLAHELSLHGVRIAFSGHNHVYERSHPLASASASSAPTRNDALGTVYTVTGGGGSALHGFRDNIPEIAFHSPEYHYLRVNVEGTEISVEAVRADGTTLDRYTR